jgi:hypothetical protein
VRTAWRCTASRRALRSFTAYGKGDKGYWVTLAAQLEKLAARTLGCNFRDAVSSRPDRQHDGKTNKILPVNKQNYAIFPPTGK